MVSMMTKIAIHSSIFELCCLFFLSLCEIGLAIVPENVIDIVLTAAKLLDNLWVFHFFMAHPVDINLRTILIGET